MIYGSRGGHSLQVLKGIILGLKRKSPENNVRRVAAIDKKSRYAIANKNGETFNMHLA